MFSEGGKKIREIFDKIKSVLLAFRGSQVAKTAKFRNSFIFSFYLNYFLDKFFTFSGEAHFAKRSLAARLLLFNLFFIL